MPVSSGYEVAEKIRSLAPPLADIPLIALSSMMKFDVKRCRTAGFDGYLSKPIRRKRLYDMIARVLSGGHEFDGKTDMVTQYSVQEDLKHSVHILLAEDNAVNRKLALAMLTKAGYQIDVVENGKQAVELLAAQPDRFDLVFMDIQMPEMDGLTATTRIRIMGLTKLPIIAMTAYAMKGDRQKCLDAGMNDYIAKPIKRNQVFDVIKRWVLDAQSNSTS